MKPAEQKKNANNVMFSGGSPYMNDATSTDVTKKQIDVAVEEYNDGDINKD